MSFDHKAFAFDWVAFSNEMLPWLSGTLAIGDRNKLMAFVDANVPICRNPYDGEPLASSWREMLEAGDIQEIADFALTKYYNPTDNHGLGDSWAEFDEGLAADFRVALLGSPIPNFDPGRQGSYFVTPSDASKYAQVLRQSPIDSIKDYGGFLNNASIQGLGAYVTF
jgi:hypothetical protein